eukprot:6465725-Amphidinium_carterae.1
MHRIQALRQLEDSSKDIVKFIPFSHSPERQKHHSLDTFKADPRAKHPRQIRNGEGGTFHEFYMTFDEEETSNSLKMNGN